MPRLIKIASRDVSHAIAQKKLDEVIVNEITKKFPKLVSLPFAINIGNYDEETQNIVGQVNVRVAKDKFIVIPVIIEDGILKPIDTFIYEKHVLPLEPWIVDLVVKQPDIVRLLYPVEEQMLRFPFTYKYAEKPSVYKLIFTSFGEPLIRKYFDFNTMSFKTEKASVHEYDLDEQEKAKLLSQGSYIVKLASDKKIYKLAVDDTELSDIRALETISQRKTEPIPTKDYNEASTESFSPNLAGGTCIMPTPKGKEVAKVFKLFAITNNELTESGFLLVSSKTFAVSPDIGFCEPTETQLDLSNVLIQPSNASPGESYFCVDPVNYVAFGPVKVNKINIELEKLEVEGAYYDKPIKIIKNPKVKHPILLPEGLLMSDIVFVNADPTRETIISTQTQNQIPEIPQVGIPKQADYMLWYDNLYNLMDLKTGKSFRFTNLDKDLMFTTLELNPKDIKALKEGKRLFFKLAESPRKAMAAKALLGHYAIYGPENVGRSLVHSIADPNKIKEVTSVVASILPVWGEFVKIAQESELNVDKDPSTTVDSVLGLNVVTDENINALLNSANGLLRVLEYLSILRLVVRLGWKGVVSEQKLNVAIQSLASIIKNILAYKKQLT